MLGERIAELRKKKGISQEELADALMTSRQAISKWERGESDPDIARLKDLAIYFDVSVDYLLGYDIETASVNGFIERMKKSFESEDFDVSIDEIRVMVSRHSNNLNLILSISEYLGFYYYATRNEEAIDLSIQYLKKAVLLYHPHNAYNCSLNDIHESIANMYLIKQRYDLAKEYIKSNQVIDNSGIMCRCEFELGNYPETEKITANIFANSVTLILNTNGIQMRLLMRTKREKEALDIADWTIDFVRSVGKDEIILLDVLFTVTFLKTVCLKALGLDYQESLKFLLDNRDKTSGYRSSGDGFKFYHSERITSGSGEKDIKSDILHEIDILEKSGYKYQPLIDIYHEVYGGD